MSITTEFREHFSWTFEGSICAIKRRKDSTEWILDLPQGQSVRLSAAALAALKANLRHLPNAALRSDNGAMARAGLPWTAEDEELLKNGFRSAMPLGTLAARLGRSRYAVELHLVKLGLTTSGGPISALPPQAARSGLDRWKG